MSNQYNPDKIQVDNFSSPIRTELMDIIKTFSIYASSRDLVRLLDNHYTWLYYLNSDQDLYHPKNKEKVAELKNFLKYPEKHFEVLIDFMDEYIQIRRSFNKTFDDNKRHEMDDYFTETVSKLEECLQVIYTQMKENTFETQIIINNLLNKKCCFDLRDEVKKYIFTNKMFVEDLLFNSPSQDYYDSSLIYYHV